MELIVVLMAICAFVYFVISQSAAASEKLKLDQQRAHTAAHVAAVEELRKENEEKMAVITMGHVKTLSRKRKQLRKIDDYGVRDSSQWEAEKNYFTKNVLVPQFNGFVTIREHTLKENRFVTEDWFFSTASWVIDNVVSAHEIAGGQCGYDYSECMSAVEYETYCADLLGESGWDARTTVASGDQGADIIAERNGKRIVVQCKKYGQPVGNKAVQEVHAARGHFGADYAAVVSNSTFTASAEQLARSLDVMLLHHSQLDDI